MGSKCDKEFCPITEWTQTSEMNKSSDEFFWFCKLYSYRGQWKFRILLITKNYDEQRTITIKALIGQ